jgi:cytochrome c peroxidase
MRKTYLSLILLLGLISIAATIDIDNLFLYGELEAPNYINLDNTPEENPITDAGATLGRVLFYDKQLSLNGTISCSSCHQQEFAFGDTAVQSFGMNGLTGRHSMRLVNARFSNEPRFFWDERAATLEDQVTMPIQDHVEMGFSGEDGDPDFDSLTTRLSEIDYYQVLFPLAFESTEVTEEFMSKALAQFVRSIQSFDSPFDEGLSQTNNINAPFPNFTQQENQGKNLYLTPQPIGGAGCAACHGPAEFSIGPLTQNNGVIGTAGSTEIDLTNTRAPSLRELVNLDGMQNGPFMHDGSLATLSDVIEHYSAIPFNPQNTNLDPRLQGPPLNLNNTEKAALEAFLITLSGIEVYTAEQWSDPFDENGNLDLIGGTTNVEGTIDSDSKTEVYPNPFHDYFIIESDLERFQVEFYNLNGAMVKQITASSGERINSADLPNGVYLLKVSSTNAKVQTVKVMKY